MRPLLLIAAAALARAHVALQPRKQSIAARGLSSWGGFALLARPCPSGTSTCAAASCCPDGYTCNTNGTPMCCPSSADCDTTVNALVACADNSWELYSFAGYFCCAPDTVGTWSYGSGRQCISRKLPVPESISLTALTQVTGSETGTRATAAATGGTSVTTSPDGSQTAGGGSGTSSGTGRGDGGSTSAPDSGLSRSATIAIAVLATAVGMLVIFIIWRFCKMRRGSNQQQQPLRNAPQHTAGFPTDAPVSERAGGTYSTPPPYRSPHPETREVSGISAPPAGAPQARPVYETDAIHRVELDTGIRK